MTKFHVNNETGKYGECRAKPGECPVSAEANHFQNKNDVVKASERVLSEKHGLMNVMKKYSSDSMNNNNSVDKNMFDDDKFRNVRKMPALFIIDREAHKGTSEINESAAWIFDEEARPTYKRDGTSITVDENGKVWARRSVKKGKKAPANYIEAEVDPVTGHSFGIEPVEQSGFFKFYKEAMDNADGKLEAGTYELCGPKVQNDPEGLGEHKLLKHGDDIAEEIPDMRNVPKDEAYDRLKNIFAGYKERGIEGVVWWGKDGKRTKLRVKDFFGDDRR